MSHPGVGHRGRLVLLRDGVDLYDCVSGIQAEGIGECVPLPLIGGFHCLCDEQGDQLLTAHPAVSLVEANPMVNLTTITMQDPSSRRAPHITEGLRAIRVPEAWRSSQGEGIGVAVFDTGIDFTHPDLINRVYGGINLISPGAHAQDDHGHGTRVAGIIAAVGKTPAVTGVAPRAKLYGVKVLDANGDGAVSDVILGLQWVIERKIPVVNMSLDIPEHSKALEAAIHKAIASGVTIIASTGNRGVSTPPAYPAAYPGVIGVSAVTLDGKPVSFGTAGPEVDLVAPGLAIQTTALRRGYTWASGTSMASPFVAGVAALYLHVHPDATPEQVRDALLRSAVSLPGVPRERQGAGLVNAADALRFGKPEAARTPENPPQPKQGAQWQLEQQPESDLLGALPPPAWEARLEEIRTKQMTMDQYVQERLEELTRLVRSLTGDPETP